MRKSHILSAFFALMVSIVAAAQTEVASSAAASARSAAGYSVGRIEMRPGVTATGARTYDIPIATAAGWNFVPTLSLSHSSQGGGGEAGCGWGIAGLSAVTQRARNTYYDCYAGPVDIDAADAVHALDGVPLVRCSDQTMYDAGFTGHEHLQHHAVLHMNARLYDPITGRFLGPDPVMPDSGFSQAFNSYSYCLDNPLKYTDPDGEFIFTTATIVGICVGTAIGTGLGVYEGYKIAEQKDLEGSSKIWTIIGGGAIGGIAGGLSSFVGAYVGTAMATAEIGGFYAGAAIGGAYGATAGCINGFGMTVLETGSLSEGFNKGLYQATIGGLSGALLGGLLQGTVSAVKGDNFWNGRNSVNQVSYINYEFDPDPDGENQILYRGTNGNETQANQLYMTDSHCCPLKVVDEVKS